MYLGLNKEKTYNFLIMNIKEPVRTVMTSEVCAVHLRDSLKEAYDLMQHRNLRYVPVLASNGQLLGVLSRRDIARLCKSKHGQFHPERARLERFSIEQIMDHQPRVAFVDQSIEEVADILSQESHLALPVTDGKRLVGIISSTDIIQYLVHQPDVKEAILAE